MHDASDDRERLSKSLFVHPALAFYHLLPLKRLLNCDLIHLFLDATPIRSKTQLANEAIVLSLWWNQASYIPWLVGARIGPEDHSYFRNIVLLVREFHSQQHS